MIIAWKISGYGGFERDIGDYIMLPVFFVIGLMVEAIFLFGIYGFYMLVKWVFVGF